MSAEHQTHPWVSMTLAILFELLGTINAKLSDGLTLHRPTSIMYMSYILSVSFLAIALDATGVGGLDLGVAYATWSGLGTVVAVLYGVLQAGETMNTAQMAGFVLTIAGVTLINMAPEWSFFGGDSKQPSYGDYDGHTTGLRNGGEHDRLLTAGNSHSNDHHTNYM